MTRLLRRLKGVISHIFIGGREGQPAVSSHTQQVNSVEQDEQTAAAMANRGTEPIPVQQNVL